MTSSERQGIDANLVRVNTTVLLSHRNRVKRSTSIVRVPVNYWVDPG
jgi:hypothetical protein